MTKRENLTTKHKNGGTNGDEIGKAIGAVPDRAKVLLLLYEIEGGKGRTANELPESAFWRWNIKNPRHGMG